MPIPLGYRGLRVFADIRPQMLKKVIENWTSRLDYIRASHMPEIIFKMKDNVHAEEDRGARQNAPYRPLSTAQDIRSRLPQRSGGFMSTQTKRNRLNEEQ
ncbi:hypothetical protein TNCV_5019541 [Trichonephila clavipes]|nr:hypothetical protein TNCV_5019541 [Trichonephila clavipes]